MFTLFKVVGLVARIDEKEALKLAKKLMSHLEDKGLSVFLEPSLAKHVKKATAALRLEEMKVDLIITIGGDGTILRTGLMMPKPEPPILAINMGVRGFLTEVTPTEASEAVDRCLKGDFVLEQYTKLSPYMGEMRLPDALNEVFITSQVPAKLLHTRIWRDNVAVAECQSDGIVVASQVGSTGYSLSGGGPVLDPKIDAFVLTPICPLTTFHPIVFSAKSTVSIELLKPKKAVVVVDGHYQMQMGTSENRLMVRKSEYKASFVRFNGDFYRRLKGRLLFPRGERL